MTASEFQVAIIDLFETNRFKISDHGLDALLDDDLGRRDVVDSISNSEILEYYPGFGKGPAILLFQAAADGRIVHCV